MKHYLRTAAVLLALVALVGSGPPTQGQIVTRDQHMYLPFLSQSPPPPPFGYGIQAHALDEPERVMNAARDLGMTWIKQQIRWDDVERADNAYDWATPDRVSEAAQAAGLQVMFSIVAAPHWTRPDKPGNGPPDNDQDMADFMAAMAARYQGRVQAYEIWNEQNLSREWDGVPLSAEHYVRLLQAVYEAIKAVDRNAIVVTGGLAPCGIDDGVTAIDDRHYLLQMYEAGVRYAADAIGAHPYGFANPALVYYTGGDLDPSRGYDDHPSFFYRNTMEDYYATMQAYGDGHKKVWATEYGWGTVDGMGVSPNPGYEYTADLSEAQQAQYIADSFQWAAAWGHAGASFLWNLNFWPVAGPDNEMAKFSIVRGDWTPRPAYDALKAVPK